MRFLAHLLFTFFIINAEAQVFNTSWGSFATSRSLNGMVYVTASSQRFQPAEVKIDVRTGSVYERTKQSGISALVAEIVGSRINELLATGMYPNFRFSFEHGFETATFRFRAPNADLNALLSFIAKEFTTIKVVEDDLKKFIPVINQKRSEDSLNTDNKFRFVLHHRLFKNDKEKMLLWGEAEDLQKLQLIEVDSFYRMNYVPNNATVSVYSSYGISQQIKMIESALINWRTTDFNPDVLTKIRAFKQMVYSSQDIVFNNPKSSTLSYNTLGYGTRNYLRGTYFNYLLSAMLNDTSQPFQKLLHEDANPKKVLANFDAGTFYGIFRLIIEPSEGEFEITHKRVLELLPRLHEFVSEENVAKGKQKFADEYQQFRDNPAYVPQSVRFYFTGSEQYMDLLNDSVQNISTKEFLKFVYLNLSTGFYANILETDSATYERENVPAWFEPVDENVGNEAFTYRKNVPDLEGDDNARLLRKLIQWLRINPDVRCQVNGIADKREFNRFADEAVREFIDTISTFRAYRPETMKKKYIRLELMRTYKILKVLVENDIDIDRLGGTAMRYSSKTPEEFALNRRSTLTLNRLKQRLPLRDVRIFAP